MNSHSRGPAADSDGTQRRFALTLHPEEMLKARGVKKLDLKALSTGSFHVDDEAARSRLHWRSAKTTIASCPVHFRTYDDLYVQSAASIDIWRDLRASDKT